MSSQSTNFDGLLCKRIIEYSPIACVTVFVSLRFAASHTQPLMLRRTLAPIGKVAMYRFIDDDAKFKKYVAS